MSFKIDFNYESNGRKVSKDEWMRDLGQEAVAQAMPAVVKDRKAAVAKLRCPAHGESPKVVNTKTAGDEIRFQISACCDEMLERAQQVAVGQ